MAGQIRWADRPTVAEAETWFRGRVRPTDPDRWAAAWSILAEEVEFDLPHLAELDGEQEAAARAEVILGQLRQAMRAGVKVVEGGEGGQRDRAGEALAPHEWARAALLAELAAAEPRVAGFRAEHLPCGLLADDRALEAWAKCSASSGAGGPVEWVGIDGVTRRRRTGPGPLDDLRVLGDWLAGRYGWAPATAVTFVLAGGVPEAPMLRTARRAGLAAWDAAVTLTVHPDVPASAVTAAYREAQATLIGPGRPRLLTGPVADAVVAATVPGTWAAKLSALGDAGGRYGSADDFRRVVERARAKLVGGDASGRLGRMLAGLGVEVRRSGG